MQLADFVFRKLYCFKGVHNSIFAGKVRVRLIHTFPPDRDRLEKRQWGQVFSPCLRSEHYRPRLCDIINDRNTTPHHAVHTACGCGPQCFILPFSYDSLDLALWVVLVRRLSPQDAYPTSCPVPA